MNTKQFWSDDGFKSAKNRTEEEEEEDEKTNTEITA